MKERTRITSTEGQSRFLVIKASSLHQSEFEHSEKFFGCSRSRSGNLNLRTIMFLLTFLLV